jgi:hypothetical protein
MLRSLARKLLWNTPIYAWRNARREQERLVAWQQDPEHAPPPQCIKYAAIAEYGRRFGTRVLIETGTFRGDAIQANLEVFPRIYSIELSVPFHRAAVRRFRPHPHVQILQGDSGKVLPELLKSIREPALFWLDGHYSGGNTAAAEIDSPLLAELAAVLSHPIPGHVILIDDARYFTGTDGYPTLTAAEELVRRQAPGHGFELKYDVIRITPPPRLARAA